MKCAVIMTDLNGGDYCFHLITEALFQKIQDIPYENMTQWMCEINEIMSPEIDSESPEILLSAYTQRGVFEFVEKERSFEIIAFLSLQEF
jgi:hypothetical protein